MEEEEILVTPCQHSFCGECIRGALAIKPNCPICRRAVAPTALKKLPPKPKLPSPVKAPKPKKSGRGPTKNVVFTAKVERCIAELRTLERTNPGDKVIIFTQFNKTIEALSQRFDSERLPYVTMTGSMTANRRKKVLQMFQQDPKIRVFLLSVRCGAVGLTLTAANHVFMLEPCMNPALHAQAINRTYRLGQTKEVYIKNFVMKNSIESQMRAVNARKDGKVGIAGNICSDKVNNKMLRETEIAMLFDQPEAASQ